MKKKFGGMKIGDRFTAEFVMTSDHPNSITAQLVQSNLMNYYNFFSKDINLEFEVKGRVPQVGDVYSTKESSKIKIEAVVKSENDSNPSFVVSVGGHIQSSVKPIYYFTDLEPLTN